MVHQAPGRPLRSPTGGQGHRVRQRRRPLRHRLRRSPRWTCQLPSLPRWDSAPVLANGILFVPSQLGTDGVHAVDATTGRLKWTFRDPD
ncbi:PQQ-binding-like beta-propeller repeat protein [Streptomyces kaniharaensis]|uniref:PQQ-binding-like beta-propeller repeat protein n=1 Tax=Streptomyces kaniharaensis TaxID=212423 RepID=A0A6N7KQM3_9ACTN|nr:PQQ-binding-like beta-propeller repeat protein [Streptomyces kaniharaensis]